MFDKVEIIIKGGKGGGGMVSFRHEKFVPFGGPDGGDGGDGGDVSVRADASLTSFRVFKSQRWYRAGHGSPGQGKGKHGKRGKDLIIAVPEGTVIWQEMPDGSNTILADLEKAGQQMVVARGGRGGWGNTHFASATNQTPRIAQSGDAGEGKCIVLELRLIADAGIVGYPNAGKSTLLSRATAARPEIASYPFTTREPVLGVVDLGSYRFVLAEIPGLIDGAHRGRGLGHEFLRHATRVKVILHLIDGTSAAPVEDMVKVNTELSLFDPTLAKKAQIVVVNKIDLAEVRGRLEEFRKAFGAVGVDVRFISAVTGEGVTELMLAVGKALSQSRGEPEKRPPVKVFHPRPVDSVKVRKEGNGHEDRGNRGNLRPDT